MPRTARVPAPGRTGHQAELDRDWRQGHCAVVAARRIAADEPQPISHPLAHEAAECRNGPGRVPVHFSTIGLSNNSKDRERVYVRFWGTRQRLGSTATKGSNGKKYAMRCSLGQIMTTVDSVRRKSVAAFGMSSLATRSTLASMSYSDKSRRMATTMQRSCAMLRRSAKR